MVSISCDSLRRNGSFEHFKTFVAPNELWRCRRRATTFFESGRTRMNHNVLDDFYHESRFVFVRCKGRYILITSNHDHVIKWKYFPHYWPCVRGIHRWPLNSPHKGQWRGALMFSFICVWISQPWGWWVETPSHPLWRHCNDYQRPLWLT